MNRDNTNKKVVNNVAWRLAERFGAQGVSLIVSIILGRLLSPSDYGIVALVVVITNILQVFVDSGLGNALIQAKNADSIDFSTVFFFNMVVCVFLYTMLFISAPLVASFYKMPEMIPVLRVLGITLIISGLKNVQQAYVSRNLLFKRFFFATLGGTILAAIIGIAMAYLGFGVWALVAQYLINLTVDTIVLWLTVKWRPIKAFSFKRLKGLFSYGWKLLAASLFTAIYDNLRSLLIGKIYTAEDLAFYNRGEQYPTMMANNVSSAVDSVLFPIVSKEQDNPPRVKAMMKRALKMSSFIISPIMIGFAVCAESLVVLLLTDKWLPAVPFIYIFCIIKVFYPINSVNVIVIQALGRSDIVLKLNIIKRILGIVILLASMPFGVFYIALAQILLSILSQIVNAYANKKLLQYSHIEQLKDLLPSICISILMGVIVYAVKYIGLSVIATLLIQILLGVLVYVVLSKLLNNEAWDYCMSLIKSYLKRK